MAMLSHCVVGRGQGGSRQIKQGLVHARAPWLPRTLEPPARLQLRAEAVAAVGGKAPSPATQPSPAHLQEGALVGEERLGLDALPHHGGRAGQPAACRRLLLRRGALQLGKLLRACSERRG
jgi:hypothetical protein